MKEKDWKKRKRPAKRLSVFARNKRHRDWLQKSKQGLHKSKQD